MTATFESSDCFFTDDVVVHDVDDFAQILVSSLNEVCVDSSAILLVNNLSEFNNYDLTWNFPNGNVSSLPIISAMEEGEYILELVDVITGCEKRDTFNFNYQFSLEFDSYSKSLSVITKGGKAPFTYLWNNGSDASSIDSLTNGSRYEVTVTDANNCQQVLSTVYADLIPDTEEKGQTIILSPNPTTGILNIAFESEEVINLNVGVFNVAGKEIFNVNYEDVQYEVPFDLSTLSSGVYIFQLKINESYSYHRVILNR